MLPTNYRPARLVFPLLLALLWPAAPCWAQAQRALTFTDLMQIRTIQQPTLSDDGAWLAFTAQPDRGDGAATVQRTEGDPRYVVPMASHPAFSADAAYVALRLNPSLEARETAADDDAPRRGLVLLRTADGDTTHWADIDAFAFSGDGRVLAAHHYAPRPADDEAADDAATDDEAPKRKGAGTLLTLHVLATGAILTIDDVTAFAFADDGHAVAYTVAAPDSSTDGLYVRDLTAQGLPAQTVHAAAGTHYTSLSWQEDGPQLAFLAAAEEKDPATLYRWDGQQRTEAATSNDAPDGWHLPLQNTVRWSDDGQRLFFGFRPAPPDDEPADEPADDDAEAEADAFAPYDLDALLADRTVDVWHTDDPRINPNQKQVWKQEQARTYAAVWHRHTGTVVPLADAHVLDSGTPENERTMLGRAEAPYFRERTWEGFFFDTYVIDLQTGTKKRVAERLSSTVSLSPGGRFVAYYMDHHWHLYDTTTGATQTPTKGLDVPFGNEDHDYPSDVPGYGLGGWVGDDAVLIYDKYDIWQVPTNGTAPLNLTGSTGRATSRTFRVIRTDPEQEAFAPGERLLLSSYHNLRKNHGFYETTIGQAGATALLEDDKRFRFVQKAEDADVYLFTREAYDEFPDLWVADPRFASPRKLTDVNPQLGDFAWGQAELIDWRSDDGIPLQGVVIKPGNYDPNRRYPVMIYFYRFFSQRLYEFNQPVVNHRPSFPLYASDGYIVFLPDVRFEIGRPGFSATKAIVPGVHKLIEMGLADPDRIGLHGHSWSGYQAAFMVTQTDIFAAAIAGAPVSNMTSAYGGIRWGTGLARQFQYEKTQSRLDATLWNGRDRYIDNSPLFFADRINTPMLIIHGDDDGAVPWYQSIELYLALRRLGKEAVFLQYRGEDHHPATYANKLDWAMKMKQYFDHYLKDAPAPAWLSEGIPYNGE